MLTHMNTYMKTKLKYIELNYFVLFWATMKSLSSLLTADLKNIDAFYRFTFSAHICLDV